MVQRGFKLRGVYFSPFCTVLFVGLTLYSRNMAVVSGTEILAPMALGVLQAYAICAILALLTKDLPRATVASTTVMLLYLARPIFGEAIPVQNNLVWAMYGIVSLLVAVLLYRLSANLTVQKTFAVISASLLTTSVLSVAQQWNTIRRDLAKADAAAEFQLRPGRRPQKQRPDIFYIILDGYGRSDALAKYMLFDNSRFMSGLQRLGFYIAPYSHSNYSQTLLSLSSSTNMDYFQNMVPTMGPDDTDSAPAERLIQKNRVAQFLRSQGYLYIGVNSTLFNHTNRSNTDRLYKGKPVTGLGSFLSTATVSDGERQEKMLAFRGLLIQSLADLKSLAPPEGKPRFVFAHLMCPHPPFLYKEDGSLREPDFDFTGLTEGPRFRDRLGSGWRQHYQSGYASAASFVGDRVLDAVAEIVRKAKVPPIIIIQGDHGSRSLMDAYELNKSDVDECMSIMNAFYGPEAFLKGIPDDVTPVNNFRLVLNYLFDTNLQLQPNKAYFSPFMKPYLFTDVTDRLKEGSLTPSPEK